MIKLADALVTDGLPEIISAKAWVEAYAKAERDMRRQELEYTEGTGVYDNLEFVSDAVLDVLACDLNIAWYNPDYSAATKRQIIQDALLVKRKMGTKYAVRRAVCDLHPNSEIEEWFEYDGAPSHFRVVCTVDNSTEPTSITALRQNVLLYKRLTARLDGFVLQTIFGAAVGTDAKVWHYTAGMTGEYSAGTWPDTSTFAALSANTPTATSLAAAFLFASDMAGTLPNTATHGILPQSCAEITTAATANAIAATPAGTETCTGAAGGGLAATGITPEAAVQGYCFDTPYCGEENL